MKVLIVKASALGDVVHALPVLAWLNSAGPGMEIDWLIEEGFATLLDGHPLLRKVHRIATRSWRQQGRQVALCEVWRVITQLRREHYDVVLDLQGNSKSALFTRLSGAVQRYGFSRDGVREWPNLLATNHHVKLTAADHHISDRSMAIARAAFPQGCVTENAGPLPLRPEAVRQVDALLDKLGLTGRRFVVLHYGTTWPTKLWAPINWQELVRRLASSTDLVPVLTWGSTGELAVVEQIASVAKGRAVIWPRGSLPELVALLAKAVVVVGGDTGPVHIAAAVGTPTVSLFRVTDASRNAPRGLQHVCLQSSLECSPCLRKSCNRDADCARSITVAEVLAALFKTQLVADQSH